MKIPYRILKKEYLDQTTTILAKQLETVGFIVLKSNTKHYTISSDQVAVSRLCCTQTAGTVPLWKRRQGQAKSPTGQILYQADAGAKLT